MSANIKKYSAILGLLIFLTPYTLVSIHSFEHKDNFHCSATTESHLHQLHHHCYLCDFEFPVLIQTSLQPVAAETGRTSILKITPFEFFPGNLCNHNIFLRAPPSV